MKVVARLREQAERYLAFVFQMALGEIGLWRKLYSGIPEIYRWSVTFFFQDWIQLLSCVTVFVPTNIRKEGSKD